MAKIYFNRPIIKHLEETTVINFFWQDEKLGESIYVRDTRKDIYRDNKVVFGDIELYEKKDEPKAWNCDIVDMRVPSYEVYGFYTGEGVNFEIIGPAEPVFVIHQQETKMSLATVGYMPQTKDEIPEATLGLFHVGTKIKYRRNGQQVVDELTKKGWVRIVGPSDYKFGIITVEDAFKEKLKREEDVKNPEKAKEFFREQKEKITKAVIDGNISSEFGGSLLSYMKDKTDNDDSFVTDYYFLADDVKKLIKLEIIL
jgi:hypothetical protein